MFQVSSKGIQLYIYIYFSFPLGLVVKQSLCIEGDLGSIPGMGRYAQRDMTSLSSVLAWRISLTEDPSRLQSIGPQRVRHIWIHWACTGTHIYIYLLLYKFFFHLCCYRISSRVACGFVVGPCWLSILYIVVSIYMLIPNSQFIPPPDFPFGNNQLGFYVNGFLMFFGGGSLIVWSRPTFLLLLLLPML